MKRIRTNEDYPLKEDYYYLLDFRRFMNPTLMPVYFTNKNTAKRILALNFPNRNTQKKFSIIRGITIKKEQIPYKIGSEKLKLGGKYLYTNKKTFQEKKSHRTLMRRRLRRMDILTNTKAKIRYDEGRLIIKHKKNHQKVANSPNSEAKVFQLERKPKKYYYLIIKKWYAQKRGRLFKMIVKRFDITNGNVMLMYLYTQRNDIFIPYLISEVRLILKQRGHEIKL